MKKPIERIGVLVAAMATLACSAAAQGDGVSYQFYGGMTYNLVENAMMESSVFTTAGLRLGVVTRPETSSPYAAWYGYPTVGLDIGWHGLEHVRCSDGSHLDNIVSASAFFERDVVRRTSFGIGYGVNLGAGFNSSTYNAELNPLNMQFSSPLLIYISGGLVGRVRVGAMWEVGAALRFAHFSTGRLAFPNSGLNLLEAELSIRYAAMTAHIPDGHRPTVDFRRLWGEVSVGGGLHRCGDEWRAFGSTSPWPNYTQCATLFYRYAPTLSSGIGLDVVYASDAFLRRLEAVERQLYGDAAVDAGRGYDNVSTGIAYTQQFHYGNFAVFGSVGAYTHRHLGRHENGRWCYQKAGIKLYIPRLKGLFLSADCLAHGFSHAFMMEFNIGYRI